MTAQINEGAAERLTARQSIIAARDVQAEEREAARLAAEARAAEDQAAREMVLKAEQAERDARAAEQPEREVASAAERKAARDASEDDLQKYLSARMSAKPHYSSLIEPR